MHVSTLVPSGESLGTRLACASTAVNVLACYQTTFCTLSASDLVFDDIIENQMSLAHV